MYNRGLAWHEEQRKADPNFKLSYYSLNNLLPEWKRELPWLTGTYSQCLQQSMKGLFETFKRFWKGDAGFPKFHKKFVSTDSFRYPQHFKMDEALSADPACRHRMGAFAVPSRMIDSKPKNVSVTPKADGWYVSIQTEIEYAIPTHHGDTRLMPDNE